MKRLTTLLLTVAILSLGFTLTGCNNDVKFTAKDYSSNGSKIEIVTIDVLDREVTVSLSDDNQFHLEYFESEREYYEITVSDDNELKMQLIKDREWTDFVETKPAAEYRKINLKIPNSLLANLAITTTNENIELSPLVVTNSISLTANGGDIVFDRISAGKSITLSAKNGNIDGNIIGSYDKFSIACEIKKGDCNLPLEKLDGEKSLKATCNNGDIKIDFVKE